MGVYLYAVHDEPVVEADGGGVRVPAARDLRHQTRHLLFRHRVTLSRHWRHLILRRYCLTHETPLPSAAAFRTRSLKLLYVKHRLLGDVQVCALNLYMSTTATKKSQY